MLTLLSSHLYQILSYCVLNYLTSLSYINIKLDWTKYIWGNFKIPTKTELNTYHPGCNNIPNVLQVDVHFKQLPSSDATVSSSETPTHARCRDVVPSGSHLVSGEDGDTLYGVGAVAGQGVAHVTLVGTHGAKPERLWTGECVSVCLVRWGSTWHLCKHHSDCYNKADDGWIPRVHKNNNLNQFRTPTIVSDRPRFKPPLQHTVYSTRPRHAIVLNYLAINVVNCMQG